VIVSAPAGFGKTALVAEWSQRRPVAWLSLEASDNDATRFWRHAIGALDRVRPGLVERVGRVLDDPSSSSEVLLTAVLNELASTSRDHEHDVDDVVLVLDDYHVIVSPVVHASLQFLLAHRPPNLRLVVATRADPPLPLARLRAAGQLTELRAADLRFTADEAAELVHEADDISLPEPAVSALVDRTEGWAVGLRLALLALRGRPDAAEFVSTFTGTHRFVLDYLTEEVLERQTQQVREFLLETSVLERLSGDLCDAVTGRVGSDALLETIERANLFVVPLDDVRGWWRYHHLFAELLRGRLQGQEPERVPELHQRAARWYEEHGIVDDAIGHAMAAGDPERAATMIEREADAVTLRNEGVTLQRWIDALPDGVAESRSRLLLALAHVALGRGNLDSVERALHAAERAREQEPDEHFEPSSGMAGSLLANVPAAITYWRAYLADLRGNTEDAIALDRQALTEVAGGQSLLAAAARLHVRAVGVECGNLTGAEGALTTIVAELRAEGFVYPALRACELLGFVQRARGRLDAAADTYRAALEIAGASAQPAPPVAGIGHVGLAEVAYQRGELEVALRHANEGVALCRQLDTALTAAPGPLTYSRPVASGLATLARIRMAGGDTTGALAIVGEHRLQSASFGVAQLFDPLPALRARLLLARGDLRAVSRWVDERDLRATDVSYSRESDHLVLARLHLAQREPERALALLDRLLELAGAQERIGSIVEIQVLRALAVSAVGDRRGAVAVLAAVLELAHPHGYVRVFADEGVAMGDLLRQLVAGQRRDRAIARGVPLGDVGELLRIIDHGSPSSSAGRRGIGVPVLAEPLTERETEVLALVAAGRSNRQIADELFVALDTVKKHVSHIFEKLGAANRTEATARARDLGLLDDTAERARASRS
jgi:LuxR family maltose regulon positive regulatory protein